MKKWLLLAPIIFFGLTSCKSTEFYQFFKVNSTNGFSRNSKSLVFEDENCRVIYDFWWNGGNAGFKIYNKTDENIYINMNESFFISNGNAYDYYLNSKTSYSKSYSESSGLTGMISYSGLDAVGFGASESVSGYNYQGNKQTNSIGGGVLSAIAGTVGLSSTKGVSHSIGSSVSFKEKEIITVPAKTFKTVAKYLVLRDYFPYYFRNCDLLQYPSKYSIVRFSEMQSPLIFSNRIVYTVGQSGRPQSFENNFYVSEIANYPKKAVTSILCLEICGEKGREKSLRLTNASPDKFYLYYTRKKGND